MTNSEEPKKKKLTGAPQLSEMILGSLKPRVGTETTRWVAGLTDDQMVAAEMAAINQGLETMTSSGSIPLKPPAITTVVFMDYLFDCFQQYAFEFNRQVPSSEYMVSLERPTMVTEALRRTWKAPQNVEVFRGRISSQYWTLLLRGHPAEIEGWILPIDQLISFASSSESFTQFLSLSASDRNGEIVWSVDGIDVTWDKVRAFAKQLFSSLVHVVKTNEPQDIVFSAKSKPAADSQAPAEAPPTPTYSFDEHNPAFDTYNYEQPVMPPKACSSPHTVPPVKERLSGLAVFIDGLPRAFQEELDKLSASGQAAFAQQDMKAVEQAIRRTNKMNALREELTAQVEGWKAKLAEALE